jgi:mannose-1-phosphate guanylyltransferase
MAGPNIHRSAHLVIMAGGSGTRFWPKSTRLRPKQLIAFGSDPHNTLIVQTLARFDSLVEPQNRWIVTTELLAGAVREQVASSVKVLAEPQGRNSAPCLYWAAREIAKQDPKGLMLAMPSDHFIKYLDRFQETVRVAIDWADRTGDLVTLGVKPDRAETGYGYLKMGAHRSEKCIQVEQFVEKPNLSRAEEFFKSGKYLWNGGMFVWRVDALIKAFDEFMPEYSKAWNASNGDVNLAYPQMTATSIDYGIMEKAKNVVSFSLDCGWDDLGSWTSLENLAAEFKIEHSVGVVAQGQAVGVDSARNIIDVPGRCVALLGVNDLIVVEHGQALLVAQKSRAQDIRLIVDAMKIARPELT